MYSIVEVAKRHVHIERHSETYMLEVSVAKRHMNTQLTDTLE